MRQIFHTLRTHLGIALVLCLGLAMAWWHEHYPHPASHEIGFQSYLSQPDGITCGPTSGAMVLRHYAINADIDQVKKLAKTEWVQGREIGMTSPDCLQIALHQLGLGCELRRGSLSELKHYVAQEKPVIVLLRSGEETWHYVVVIGYDEDYIYTADPASGRREKMRQADFMASWRFRATMRGKATGYICPVCGGDGKVGVLPGSCDLCGGRGRMDPLRPLLRSLEVYPQMMIVPKSAPFR